MLTPDLHKNIIFLCRFCRLRNLANLLELYYMRSYIFFAFYVTKNLVLHRFWLVSKNVEFTIWILMRNNVFVNMQFFKRVCLLRNENLWWEGCRITTQSSFPLLLQNPSQGELQSQIQIPPFVPYNKLAYLFATNKIT